MSQEVDEIKARLDIVDVITPYVPLKRAGANFKGVCPFHQEKSPSFMVSQTKQIWHCFGCHEGGDVLSFVQKIEGLSFFETLVMLGERVGVKVQKRPDKPGETPDVKQRLRELLAVSAKFFHAVLTDHPKAKDARAYADKRKLQRTTIDLFQLGYAPESWDTLTKFLRAKGYTPQEMVASGMVIFNQERKSYYDRFRNRFMIPLRDVHGNVVGFTARAIGDSYEGGKYINTPQTVLYDKSKIVFAIDQARQAIKEAGYAVIVEGNMDAISSHQAGVKPVVAVSGTAFTEAQIALLKRFTKTLVFSFDSDAAGLMAARRSVELALKAGMEVKMLTLPFGKDPDECIQQDVNAWKTAIASARPMLEELIKRSVQKNDPYSAPGKKAIQEDVLSVMAYLSNPVEIDHYLRILSDEIQTQPQILFEELKKRAGAQAHASGPKPSTPSATLVSKQSQPMLSEDQQALFEFLSLALLSPALLEKLDPSWLPEQSSLTELYKTLYSYYSSSITGAPLPDFQAFITSLSPELQESVVRIQLFGDNAFADVPPVDLQSHAHVRLHFLKKKYLLRELGRIQSALKQAERSGDATTLPELMRAFSQVSEQLAQLG